MHPGIFFSFMLSRWISTSQKFPKPDLGSGLYLCKSVHNLPSITHFSRLVTSGDMLMVVELLPRASPLLASGLRGRVL